MVVLSYHRPSGTEFREPLFQLLYFRGSQRHVLVLLHFLDGIVEFLGVAVPAEVFDPVFDLRLRPLRKVNCPVLADVQLRLQHDQNQPVLQFTELGLGFQSFGDDGDQQGLQKRGMVFENLNSFLSRHVAKLRL